MVDSEMVNRERQLGDGRQRRADLAVQAKLEPASSPEDSLLAAARDAIDSITVMARDGAALAALETRRTVREFGPKVAWGVVAAVFGAAAIVLALVALVIAVEPLIPALSGRLALLAAILFATAVLGAILARPRRASRRP